LVREFLGNLTARGLHVIKDCFGATPKPGRRGDRSPDKRSPLAFRSIWGTKGLWGRVVTYKE